MLITVCKSKIHRATITDTSIDYVGSITIDEELMKLAGLVEFEKVQIANINNGERVETYVVAAPEGSGQIGILGAAARKFQPGDMVIIISFGYYSPEEMQHRKPLTVVADEKNNIARIL